ncbi:MAG: efflux RND transporter periplasmic adaptor subunit [Wenzhouxiangellaceae bacterium]
MVTAAVQLQPGYNVQREFAGRVLAGQSSRLGFERGGQVEQILVDEGAAVEQGQLLARLDTRLLEAERDQLAAQLEQLQAERALAQRNLQRIDQLQQRQLASERERDELDTQVDVLAASILRVQAQLAANQTQLDQSLLHAPFAARIASREIDSGVVVAAGTPVLELTESSAMEVRTGVPVELARDLQVGDELAIRIGGQHISGEVISVAPTVDQATRSRALRLRIDGDWSPGDLAYVQIDRYREAAGAWLPDTAVTEGVRGTWAVYAVAGAAETATLESRSVVVLHARGDQVYVQGALAAGEQVVTAGLHRLAPGQRVRTDSWERLADVR